MTILKKNTWFNAVFAIGLVFVISSCSSIQRTEETVSSDGVRGVTVSKKPAAAQAVLASATVYFEYDSSQLTSKSIQALKSVVTLMKNNRNITLLLEGHADERGTREYNLALGQRRAESVTSYLVANGINKSRLQTISYGEERPVALGSNNASWSKNRRVEIK
tara:strand:+ start:17359 stop:17847 length:489 start_codon:yes stop_codon:yes gene_type:complete